ncbi:MAG: efflux RND transporter periplasmic adaptor subunit [Sedimentisphaerales bacterium]|nr:efflux RND transporter periplasmic adaptor subunit [Sedimentisphaerales bacterium]
MTVAQSRKSSWVKEISILVLLLIGFAVGFFLRPLLFDKTGVSHAEEATAGQGQTIWTCSMHPQIRRNQPGKCPLCHMDLIPLSQMASASTQIELSEDAVKLMDIQTSPVERKFVTAEVRMVGKLEFDETRIKAITTYVPGRIDRLFVDYTGITVRQGDHMVELYSPELISAQAELLQALNRVRDLPQDSAGIVQNSAQTNLTASREKLGLLGLTEQQIERIEQSGKVLDRLTIFAPRGGIVIEKNATEGMYVQTGTRIYTIADLSQLWVKLDAYESDMMWLRYGQEVEFTTESYPGELFKGTISFIDPVLNDRTRTIKVRVNVPNPDERLKPNMFVRAVVRSQIASAGKVMDPRLEGKWICPMHPEIVKDLPGTCDICKMDLVAAESMGYVSAKGPMEPPLVIPASAPLITGKRAVVYMPEPNSKTPTYLLREIVLGPRAGDWYLVEKGLSQGDQVVTNGNFKIDSEMQIRGKISMMNPTRNTEQETATIDTQAIDPSMVMNGKQTICPVMGNPIDETVFTEYQGKKVYFCCPGCIDTFLAEPDKYLAKLPQFQTNPANQ